MSKKLRYFVKLDKEGTPISTTNIARNKTPKAGVWQEIFKNTCCGEEVDITIADLEFGAGLTLTVTCDDGPEYTFVHTTDLGTLTISEIAAYLNDNFPFVGKFWVKDENEITVKLESNFWHDFCEAGAVTVTVTETIV